MKNEYIDVAAWVESDITPFDDRDTYRAHIEPLVEALVKKCHELDVTINIEAFVRIQPDGTPSVLGARYYKSGLGNIPAEAMARTLAPDVSRESLVKLVRLLTVDAERIFRLRDANAVPDITH